VLDEQRMTQILLALTADEDVGDPTLPQAFSFAAVVAATEGEWGLSADEAAQAVHVWLGTHGEVNAVANPALLLIHRDWWDELVAKHGEPG
jgi:hypothetical protein